MTSTETRGRAPRRATIDDVAAEAGVSVATVSRALRGLPNVAEATRQRVTDVAARLAYRPDPAAARLAAGTTGTITVAVPSLNGWYFSTVVAGAEGVCTEAGLEFQVIAVSSGQQRDRLLDDAHRIERRTDGLILIDIVVTPEQAASLQRRRVAVATVGSRMPGHPSVAIDDTQVGRIAAEHLLDLGHRDIAMIGGVGDGPLHFQVPLTRRRVFQQTLSERGVSLPDERFAVGHFDLSGGYQAMTRLLDVDDPPTAVFALSDEMAFGALMAFKDRSLQPGVDISIMGVDDHEFAEVVDLTTIRQPVAEHGSIAASILIDDMARAAAAASPTEVEPPQVEPDVTLIHRASTRRI